MKVWQIGDEILIGPVEQHLRGHTCSWGLHRLRPDTEEWFSISLRTVDPLQYPLGTAFDLQGRVQPVCNLNGFGRVQKSFSSFNFIIEKPFLLWVEQERPSMGFRGDPIGAIFGLACSSLKRCRGKVENSSQLLMTQSIASIKWNSRIIVANLQDLVLWSRLEL